MMLSTVSEEVLVLMSCSLGNLWLLSDFLYSSAYRNGSVTRAFSIPFLTIFLIVNEQNSLLNIILFVFPCRLTNWERKGWLCNIYVPVFVRSTSHCKWSHLAFSFGCLVDVSLPMRRLIYSGSRSTWVSEPGRGKALLWNVASTLGEDTAHWGLFPMW